MGSTSLQHKNTGPIVCVVIEKGVVLVDQEHTVLCLIVDVALLLLNYLTQDQNFKWSFLPLAHFLLLFHISCHTFNKPPSVSKMNSITFRLSSCLVRYLLF